MDKGKIVAIITGAISILIAIAYLVLVQLIDFRGEMIPAPIDQLSALQVQPQKALPVDKYIVIFK